MAEVLRLKSKAVKVFDYSGLDLSEFIPEFTPDEEVLKKDLDRVLKAYGKKIEGETAEAGDMIVITSILSSLGGLLLLAFLAASSVRL